jgi:hypothetical protein
MCRECVKESKSVRERTQKNEMYLYVYVDDNSLQCQFCKMVSRAMEEKEYLC